MVFGCNFSYPQFQLSVLDYLWSQRSRRAGASVAIAPGATRGLKCQEIMFKEVLGAFQPLSNMKMPPSNSHSTTPPLFNFWGEGRGAKFYVRPRLHSGQLLLCVRERQLSCLSVCSVRERQLSYLSVCSVRDRAV